MLRAASTKPSRPISESTRPFVTPELSTFAVTSLFSGDLAMQSVNVPPTSIQNSHKADMLLVLSSRVRSLKCACTCGRHDESGRAFDLSTSAESDKRRRQ